MRNPREMLEDEVKLMGPFGEHWRGTLRNLLPDEFVAAIEDWCPKPRGLPRAPTNATEGAGGVA